jgi:hypothetical protein
MGVTDQLQALLDKALALHSEYAVLNTNFKRLQEDVHRLLDQFERRYDELRKENTDLRERVTKLEASFDSAVKASVKEALVQVAREYATDHGSLPLDFSSLLSGNQGKLPPPK